eukprot:PhF_6_TR29438/c0_g1_i13/m.43606/K07359/CAMKK2; calcium/calmodulin-dependent protein kinase kinase 2
MGCCSSTTAQQPIENITTTTTKTSVAATTVGNSSFASSSSSILLKSNPPTTTTAGEDNNNNNPTTSATTSSLTPVVPSPISPLLPPPPHPPHNENRSSSSNDLFQPPPTLEPLQIPPSSPTDDNYEFSVLTSPLLPPPDQLLLVSTYHHSDGNCLSFHSSPPLGYLSDTSSPTAPPLELPGAHMSEEIQYSPRMKELNMIPIHKIAMEQIFTLDSNAGSPVSHSHHNSTHNTVDEQLPSPKFIEISFNPPSINNNSNHNTCDSSDANGLMSLRMKRAHTSASELGSLSDGGSSEHAVIVSTDIVKGYDSNGNKLLNEYAMIGSLGEGAYGKVKLAIDTRSETPVAIKVLNKARFRKKVAQNRAFSPRHQRDSGDGGDGARQAADKDVLHRVHREIEIMKQFRHPNLARLYAVIDNEENDKLYLVMKYMAGGTIGNTPQLVSYDPRSTPARVEWVEGGLPLFRALFRNVLRGLMFLHKHNVAHFDVKPENILREGCGGGDNGGVEDGECCVSDFGLARVMGNYTSSEEGTLDVATDAAAAHSSTVGTPVYFAPELMKEDRTRHNKGGKASDVWAFGVTMYAVLFNVLPFPADTYMEYSDKVMNQSPAIPTWLPDDVFPPSLIDVLHRTMSVDPAKRPRVKDILKHPFFCEEKP